MFFMCFVIKKNYNSYMNPDTSIKKAVDKIRININPEKIILFGSYAYSKPNNIDIDIDIDFFILFDSYEKPAL